MTALNLLVLYLLGSFITFEYYVLKDRQEYEFIVFSALFYPLIIVVWTLLFMLGIVAGAIWGIGEKIRIAKGRQKNAE